MAEMLEKLRLSYELEADPVVVELAGQRQEMATIAFLVYGVGKQESLEVSLDEIPAAGDFRFEPLETVWSFPGPRKPEEPMPVRLKLRCTADETARGKEAQTEVVVRLRLMPAATRRPAPEGGAELAPAAGAEPPVEPAEDSFTLGLIATSDRVIPLWAVLREEVLALAPPGRGRDALAEDPIFEDPQQDERSKLARVFTHVHGLDPGLSALCLSGGGIRSATFNLGVVQGLADAGALAHFDYLSSVSGGGYIASWLTGWIHRQEGLDRVLPYLEEPREGAGVNVIEPEAYSIRFLRRYSNYLTPRLGALSLDSWTVAATVIRNLLLNWLVLVPILAAALALPLVTISRADWASEPRLAPWLYGAALVLVAGGVYFMSLLRASADPKAPKDGSGWKQWFLRLGLFPTLLASALLAWAVALYAPNAQPGALVPLLLCLGWAVAAPACGFIPGAVFMRRVDPDRQRPNLVVEILAATLGGVLVALVYWAILAHWVEPLLASRWPLYALFAPALVLGPMLLGVFLFVGFASVSEEAGYPFELGDADREWWSRWGAWLMLSALVWTVAAAITFFAAAILDSAVEWVSAVVSAGGLGALASRLGKNAELGRGQKLALALAAPLFCFVLLVLVAAGGQELLWRVFDAGGGADLPGGMRPPFRGALWQLAAVIAGLALFGFGLGRFVNVNRFSLHAMYRDRLVRAYLGASNPRRRANLFTGFDPGDDLRLHRLHPVRPWPFVNIALNLVSGKELAWQERKAESFTATPLHCGAARLGYRRSHVYGGDNGLSVGTAVATSGAAASPNMGYHSSPAVTFVMALFNARLGTWLGNPGAAGSGSYTRGHPASSVRLLFAEAFGKTDAGHPYVYLSDGGHFENLGLYEMVRRRCRTIVVCDVGCDPAFQLDDLGNAIRKVRIDLGIPIEFEHRIPIYPKTMEGQKPDASYCAVGRIRYSAVDAKDPASGKQAPDGFLLYLKPAILDQESYDVTNYARSSKDFPHESTADQWFSESQFESYRILGKNMVAKIVGKSPHPLPLKSLEELKENVESYLASSSRSRNRRRSRSPSRRGTANPTLQKPPP